MNRLDASAECRPQRRFWRLASRLTGTGLAVLALGAPRLGATQLPSAAAPSPASLATAAVAPPAATAPETSCTAAIPPAAGTDASPAPAVASASSAPAPVELLSASPLVSGPVPPPAASDTAAEAEHISAGMPVWKLLAVDARSILTAPVSWTEHDWAVFGIGVAGVAGLTLADKHLRTEALRGDAPLETTLANDFRYFGNYAAFGVLGAFYAGGRLGNDAKAQETALDGLIASILAGGVITTAIKEVAGRSRPSTHQGVYDFHPFSGNASFPSGESTEAFAAGSVIAAQYPNPWVEISCYGTASLVAFARMREDGHWASDVVMGALIGTTVGRAVVHLNRRLRARVSVAPLLAPGAQGLTIHTAF